jgi:hypothetical protein
MQLLNKNKAISFGELQLAEYKIKVKFIYTDNFKPHL